MKNYPPYLLPGPRPAASLNLSPVLHGVGVGEPLDDLGDGGPLLADGDVDAVELLLLVAGVVEPLLVDDGVDGHGRLARLPVADDQLALAAPDRHQRVDGLRIRKRGYGMGQEREANSNRVPPRFCSTYAREVKPQKSC